MPVVKNGYARAAGFIRTTRIKGSRQRFDFVQFVTAPSTARDARGR